MIEPRPLKVLIVEDEALLAVQLEDDLSFEGHQVVGSATNAVDAVALAAATHPDLALVDVHLADGPTGVDAAREIVKTGATVVFMTANVKRIPDDFAGAVGVIPKPYTLNGLKHAIDFIARAISCGAPPPPPRSLRLAPHLSTDCDAIHFVT